MLLLCVHLLILVSSQIFVETHQQLSNYVVEISTGAIRGCKNVTIGQKRPYYSFRGIPFAEAPIHELRFAPPIPKRKWFGVLDATKDGPSCIQSTKPVLGKEDCLNINVYTPIITSKLPVLVYIYGGGFTAGKSTYNNSGPDYFLEQDLIVVTFNYRLGVFGFLSSGDLVLPGNNGLRDQILALKWVQDNIKFFGGDKNKVTIMGQSAGAASVSYLLQTKHAKGLFRAAIMESGVSLCLWALTRQHRKLFFGIGEELSFNTRNSKILLSSLRKIDAETLQIVASKKADLMLIKSNPRDGLIFSPVIEPEHNEAIVSEKSHFLLSRGKFLKIPCLIGFNSREGTLNIGDLMRIFLIQYDTNPWKLMPIDMNIFENKLKTNIGLKIKSHYFGKIPISFSTNELIKFIGDDQFVRPINEFVNLISKRTRTYFYTFSYQGGLWGIKNRSRPGVTHSEELGYLWRSKYENQASCQDKIVRRKMVTLWSNFVKTGNPTPKFDEILDNIVWPIVGFNENLTYLEINNTLSLKENPERYDMQFWNELYEQYGKAPYDTY